MSNYKPPQAEIDAAPKVVLGGKTFSIPLLAPRQNRVVVPSAVKLFHITSFDKVDEEAYDLLCKVVHTALTRAQPELTFEEFMDLPINIRELLEVMQTIFLQTGILKQEPASGEAVAGEQAQLPLIGTN